MKKKEFKIAVATNGRNEMEDSVSEVFGRAKTFTILHIKDEEVQKVRVIDNPALSYKCGAGPIAVKTLVDLGVNLVVAPQLGQGAQSLLEQHDIEIILKRKGTKVAEAVNDVLEESRMEISSFEKLSTPNEN